MEKVMGGIYRFSLPVPFVEPVNVYFFAGRVPTLIDTAMAWRNNLAALEKGLADLGYALTDIRQILLTHAHLDHYALARKLQDISGAKVFILKEEQPFMEDYYYGREEAVTARVLERLGIPASYLADMESFYQNAKRFFLADGLPQVETLQDGETVEAGDYRLKVLHCPGHTPGQACFYLPAAKTLFSGDHILEEITPNVHVAFGAAGYQGYLPVYLASLKRLARDLAVQRVLPGHGPAFGGLKERVNKIEADSVERRNFFARVLQEKPWQVSELVEYFLQTINASPANGNFFLALREVLNYLQLLEEI